LLKGSEDSPACLSDEGSVKVKTLQLLEMAWDRDRGNLIFLINVELYNFEEKM
jgi:hypothetical protein